MHHGAHKEAHDHAEAKGLGLPWLQSEALNVFVEVIAFLGNLGSKNCDEPSFVSIPVGKHVELHIEGKTIKSTPKCLAIGYPKVILGVPL